MMNFKHTPLICYGNSYQFHQCDIIRLAYRLSLIMLYTIYFISFLRSVIDIIYIYYIIHTNIKHNKIIFIIIDTKAKKLA